MNVQTILGDKGTEVATIAADATVADAVVRVPSPDPFPDRGDVRADLVDCRGGAGRTAQSVLLRRAAPRPAR